MSYPLPNTKKEASHHHKLSYIFVIFIFVCIVYLTIDSRLSGEVEDLVTNPPPKGQRYDWIKQQMIQRFSKSEAHRVRQLISGTDVASSRPVCASTPTTALPLTVEPAVQILHPGGLTTVLVSSEMQAATALKIPVYVSEQYPKGLGPTTGDIKLDDAAMIYEKTKFSMYTNDLVDKLNADLPDLKSVVLFGIEAHVCIEQTVIDFLNQDVAVHVLADGVSSRSLLDRGLALQRFHTVGCFVNTAESVLFKLLKDKKHPAFKQISKLSHTPTPDQFGAKLLERKLE